MTGRFPLALRPRLAALSLLPLLAGCGFTPLYATPGLTPELAGMEVIVPQQRTGYLLREQLNDELGRRPGDPVRYRLACSILQTRAPRGVRVNNVANRYEIDLTVNYVLSEAGGGKVLLRGSAPVIVTYDSADAPYAGVAAEQDGEERAATQAAIQMRLQLSRFFTGHSSSPALAPTPVNPIEDTSIATGSASSQPTNGEIPPDEGSPVTPPPGPDASQNTPGGSPP